MLNGGQAHALRAGQHEYPFRFKIPFNNGCADPSSQQMGLGSGFGGLGLGGLQQMQYRHAKKTLPPSLTGFPGEAEIRYYIKVTVQVCTFSLTVGDNLRALGSRFSSILLLAQKSCWRRMEECSILTGAISDLACSKRIGGLKSDSSSYQSSHRDRQNLRTKFTPGDRSSLQSDWLAIRGKVGA